MQIYEYGSQDASIVLIEPIHVPEGMEDEAERIRKLAGMDFRLLAVKVDWFRDLSPWKAPAVYGDIPFGDEAGETLDRILELTGEPEKRYILGGYSMGVFLPCGQHAGQTLFPLLRRLHLPYGSPVLRNT